MNICEKLERLIKADWHIPKEFGAVYDFGAQTRNVKAAEWVYEIAELEDNYTRLEAENAKLKRKLEEPRTCPECNYGMDEWSEWITKRDALAEGED